MRRRYVIASHAVGLLLLVGGAAYAYYGASRLASAERYKTSAQRLAPELQKGLRLAERRRQYRDEAKAFLARRDELGLQADAWEQRQISYDRDAVSREKAVEIVDSVAPRKDSLFAPETFELRVPDPSLGLFKVPPYEQRQVALKMAGSLYLRVGGQP